MTYFEFRDRYLDLLKSQRSCMYNISSFTINLDKIGIEDFIVLEIITKIIHQFNKQRAQIAMAQSIPYVKAVETIMQTSNKIIKLTLSLSFRLKELLLQAILIDNCDKQIQLLEVFSETNFRCGSLYKEIIYCRNSNPIGTELIWENNKDTNYIKVIYELAKKAFVLYGNHDNWSERYITTMLYTSDCYETFKEDLYNKGGEGLLQIFKHFKNNVPK